MTTSVTDASPVKQLPTTSTCVDPSRLSTRMMTRLDSLRLQTLLASDATGFRRVRRFVPAPQEDFNLEIRVYLAEVGSITLLSEPHEGDAEPHYGPTGGIKLHLLSGVYVTVSTRESFGTPVLDVAVVSGRSDTGQFRYMKNVLHGLCDIGHTWLDD